MGTYNSDPVVLTSASTWQVDSSTKGKLYSRLLEIASNTNNDFQFLMGAPGSKKPFWYQRDLSKKGGDTMVMQVMGDLAGDPVLGERELTGHTKRTRFKTYSVQVDYHRGGFELTKKQLRFLAAGGDLESKVMDLLGKSDGRDKMWHMMKRLIASVDGNQILPEGANTINDIRSTMTLGPGLAVKAKSKLSGLGARPVEMQTAAKTGSKVHNYLCFACSQALNGLRDSTQYAQATVHAGVRDNDANPNFSGVLVPYMGMWFYEHYIVQPDADDSLGSPMLPLATIAATATLGNTSVLSFGLDTASINYSKFFPGYRWEFSEDEQLAEDSGQHYLWIINPDGTGAFVRYLGSTNTGHQITINQVLSGSGGTTTVGSYVWGDLAAEDQALITKDIVAGAVVIWCNSRGVPLCRSWVFGAGAALQGVGGLDYEPTTESRDFGFVKGHGYEAIFGNQVCKDSLGKPRHYVEIIHAVEHEGYAPPVVIDD